jgi:cytochrome c peroxidase
MSSWVFIIAVSLVLSACHADSAADGSNAGSAGRELGARLFEDKRLSLDGTMSCQSCHEPDKAFSDGLALSTGVTGEILPRNSQSLLYVGFFRQLTWSNPVLTRLEQQIVVPLFGESPPEMHLGPRWPEVQVTLSQDPELRDLWKQAFPDRDATAPIALIEITSALSQFIRGLASFSSAYDRYLAGDSEALGESAERGLAHFSGKAGCVRCHSGPLLNGQEQKDSLWSDNLFEKNGISGDVKPLLHPPGLSEFTGDEADWNRFRVPTLRNISKSAPYLHDGRVADLMTLLTLYNQVQSLGLDAQDLEDLEAFLKALDDASE